MPGMRSLRHRREEDQRDNVGCVSTVYSRAMREVIAKHIFEAAQQGIKDPVLLADEAVDFLVANYADDFRPQATETV